jgi:ribosomal protein L24E
LEQNVDKINWLCLSNNFAALPIFLQNSDKIHFKNHFEAFFQNVTKESYYWEYLSKHPDAIQLLKQNPDKINWRWLSKNPAAGAIEIMEQKLNQIFWMGWDGLNWRDFLSENPSAIRLLKRFPELINFRLLSSNTNPEAIQLLEQNPEKINSIHLSYNKTTEAIQLLERNPDKIEWYCLSTNPAAIKMLERNPDKIHWNILSKNPAIFEIDYVAIKNKIAPFKEELIAAVWHPSRISAILESGGDIDDY